MPTVQMPDGTLVDMPDQLTPELGKRLRALQQSEFLKSPSLADKIPDNIQQTTPEKQDTLLQKLRAPSDVTLAMGTGMIAGAVAPILGVGGELLFGEYGQKTAPKYAQQVQNALTYQPSSQTAQNALQSIGRGAHELGLEALPGFAGEANLLARSVGQQAAPAANALARTVGGGVADVGKSMLNRGTPAVESALPGMGAADVQAAILRQSRANELPVPIKLTKGMATKDYEQMKFEKETAKLAEGEPLRQAVALKNEQVLQNFDEFAERTGAAVSEPRAVGQIVDTALKNRVASVKGKINAAYQEAEAAGELANPVNYSPVMDYLQSQTPTVRTSLAPIISAVEEQLMKNDPARTGVIPIKQMEDIRQLVRQNTQQGTPNAPHAQAIIKLIDDANEAAGGDLYKRARMLYRNYAEEFKNTAVVDKLLRNKPGTTDRAVAFEDVMNHSILNGSFDDVRAIRSTLQKAGSEGNQAWRELQGATIRQIKDEITKNVARDINGNPIVSPARLDRLIKTLDTDGKLDLIFGKQGAQQLRTINDVAKDLYTAPPGSVNFSNTASALTSAIDTMASAFTGMPMIPATALRYIVKQRKTNELTRRMGEALNYNALNAQP